MEIDSITVMTKFSIPFKYIYYLNSPSNDIFHSKFFAVLKMPISIDI